MGVGDAIGRLIELRQRERRAQLEALCLLMLRNSDGGQERFLGRRLVSRIGLQEDFAADAVALRRESTLPAALDLGDGVIDGDERRLKFAGFCLCLGQDRVEEWDVVAHRLLAAGPHAVAHFCENGAKAIPASPRPRCKKFAVSSPHLHLVGPRNVDKTFDVSGSGSKTSPHHFKYRQVKMGVR